MVQAYDSSQSEVHVDANPEEAEVRSLVAQIGVDHVAVGQE